MSMIVVHLSNEVLETNVGDSMIAIAGEGSHVDVGRSMHVVH